MIAPMHVRRRAISALMVLSACYSGAGAEDLPALIEQSKPSLLLIGTFADTDNPRFTFRGTGFVVGDGRLAITNAHVLPPDGEMVVANRRLVIQSRDAGSGVWRMRGAKVVGSDATHDLVLLRFDGAEMPALRLAPEGRVREGGAIALMGFPLGGALGFSPVTHRGIVSAITAIALPPPTARTLNPQAIRQFRDGVFDIIQLDATAYPGNSGGPVFSIDSGEVLGVVNMVLVKGRKETALSSPSGISYAIPAHFARQLIDAERKD
ncbi:S1C family serine protease [Paucibacter soli]|uniref:S1C family serine protease n=1 Tax=Paucibacter soli TaxID=3133433 RepID=UPI0030973CAC